MNRLNTRVILSIASFPLVLLTISSALAQAQDEATEEIVVVGTRGEARDPLKSAVPVDLISADEIAAAHSFGGELGELLQALAPSFSFPRQSNSGLGDHVRAAQLRGMSPDHVLVLVNGKRQHTAAVVSLETKIGLGTNPFDFNTIPLIAIKRIEILRDGAGAQYGSDAIAGVINIVLKDAAQGGSVTASFGQHRTDFDPIDDDIDDGDTFSVAADYGFVRLAMAAACELAASIAPEMRRTGPALVCCLSSRIRRRPTWRWIPRAYSHRATVALTTFTSFTMRLFRSGSANSIRLVVIPIVRPTVRAFSVIRTDSRACPASTRTVFGR
jgi:hypothetical protein